MRRITLDVAKNRSPKRALFRGAATAWILAGQLVAASALGQESHSDAKLSPEDLFQTSDNCMACHNGLTTATGEDVSIGSDWRASMMANSARDPYWHAAVRREIMDHPESRAQIEAECSRCHMPMATVGREMAGEHGQVFGHLPVGKTSKPADLLAADGVSCTVCHQIQDENFGKQASYNGHFSVDPSLPAGERLIFGPFAVDAGRETVMHSAAAFRPTESPHVQQSELCATCHTLFTHSLGPNGDTVGTLPEQVPYLEWLNSEYRESKSCQTCHMPVVRDSVAISSVMGQARSGMSRHQFRGGNFFMLRMLNRYRDELGVVALPQELELAAQRTVQHLQSDAARVSIEPIEIAGEKLRIDVTVENLAGHKFPTAYPSRRAWLQVTVQDASGTTMFESGTFRDDGSITGNDNDADPQRYEPHHMEIDDPSDVQIYESIMLDQDDRPTTGLLFGVRYAKDNRILPRGFDRDAASSDIAILGAAATDADFADGRDRVRYVADVSDFHGPFTVEATLWFQPIAYRWAQNLRDYDAFETNRFTAYYESMAASSAIILARDRTLVD